MVFVLLLCLCHRLSKSAGMPTASPQASLPCPSTGQLVLAASQVPLGLTGITSPLEEHPFEAFSSTEHALAI